MAKLTIAIPTYNAEKTIEASIRSALAQNFKDKEVLVIDDCSTDRTVEIINKFPVTFYVNPCNIGIGFNLEHLQKKAKGDIIVYLCQDDLFTNSLVCWDIYNIFNDNPKIGIVGRSYYEFTGDNLKPLQTFRDMNILTSSCNPSGMAFRRDRKARSSNNIFVEMPTMVAYYLQHGWEWTMIDYDTIAVRIHPGGNTATKEEYYEGSMYQNWFKLLGQPLRYYQGLIQIKNRSPKTLWSELCVIAKTDKRSFVSPQFYFYSLMAIIIPSSILRKLSSFYRTHIAPMFVSVKERPNEDICHRI